MDRVFGVRPHCKCGQEMYRTAYEYLTEFYCPDQRIWNFWKHSFARILHHTDQNYEYLKSCYPAIYL